jgi:ABC-2 type transport system permease protein
MIETIHLTTATMHPPTLAPRRALFSTVLRSERIKLSAIRSTLIILLVSFAVGIGVSALTGYLASSHHVSSTRAGKATWNLAALSLNGFQLAELALVALVVLVVISESCWSSTRHVPPSSSARP